MKRTVVIKKGMFKKVAMFSAPDLKLVATWLKPGDKVKYDEKDFNDLYLDKYGEVPYKKIFYNGQEGYIVKSALEVK